MIVKKMKSIKNDVRELLVKYPHYKDNDAKLISAFYYFKYGGKNVFEKKTAMEFLTDFAHGKFPFPDTITRVRRKLQESEPELRGENYKKRHQHDDDVKKSIHKL
jgi:hypothetical protein